MKTLQESILSSQSDIIKGIDDETNIIKALGQFNKSYDDTFNNKLVFSLSSWYKDKDIDEDDIRELCEDEARWVDFNWDECETSCFSAWMLRKIFTTITNEVECYYFGFGPGQAMEDAYIEDLYNNVDDSYTYEKSDKKQLKYIADFFNKKDISNASYCKIFNLEEYGENTIFVAFSKSKPSQLLDGIFACMFDDGEANVKLRNKVRAAK